MIEGNKSFASIPLLSNLPGTTKINFRITNEMRDPRIKRFFQVFRRGYQIQVARDVHHFAGRCWTHLVRVTAFSLKLLSSDDSPFAQVLYHLSKRDALTVLRRRENHNHSDEDEAFHCSRDLYDSENYMRGNGGDGDDGVVETEAMSLEMAVVEVGQVMVVGLEEEEIASVPVSASGGPIAAQEITLAPVTAIPQTVQLTMEALNTPMIANALPGDIFRLKVLLPLGELYFFNVYWLTATLFPLVLGVPAARLPFEEFVERRPNMHTLEIQSYRTWYLRHMPTLVGFMNTPPLLHCPQAIEVKMEIHVMKDPRVNAPSNLACFTYLFELQMIEGNKSFASIPLLSNLPGTTKINFRITNEMRDPRIKRFFQVFRRGYQIQVARDVHHFAGRCWTHLVRVTAFSLKLLSSDDSPFAQVLYHLSKRDALTVLRRRENHNHSDEDEAFHCSHDPYDSENYMRGHNGGDGDDGIVETEAMSLEMAVVEVGQVMMVGVEEEIAEATAVVE
eukprot:gene12827-14054_t